MDSIKNFIKIHQQKIVLATGFLLVAVLSFGAGKISTVKNSAPEIKVEESFSAPNNYTPNIAGVQSETIQAAPVSAALNCDGKIKGSSSLIYHVPGGSFYDRTTNPVRCFDTEAQAIAAGFRKSAK